jgi:hypothetical protein
MPALMADVEDLREEPYNPQDHTIKVREREREREREEVNACLCIYSLNPFSFVRNL